MAGQGSGEKHYDHHDPQVAVDFVTRLGHDLADRSYPIEVNAWAGPSSAGDIRSQHGTKRSTPTLPPKQLTT